MTQILLIDADPFLVLSAMTCRIRVIRVLWRSLCCEHQLLIPYTRLKPDLLSFRRHALQRMPDLRRLFSES
jgi:hypothetical protein